MNRNLKKGLLVFICLSILVSVFSSCTVNKSYVGAPDGMRPINEGEEGGIAYVPISWSVDTSTGIPTAYVSANNRTSITLVTVPGDRVGASIPEYFNSFRTSFEQSFKDFKIIKASENDSDYETRLIGGVAAYIYVYSGKVTEKSLKFKQAFFQNSNDKTLFIITYSAIEEVYENYLKTLDEVYDNFKFVTEPIPMTDKTEINLPSVEGIEVPEGYTLISNKFVDYYFFIPNTWTPSVNTGMSAAFATENKKVTANVTAFNTTYMSLDDYWANYEKDLISTFGNINYTEESKYTGSVFGQVEGARCYSYKITQSGVEYLCTQHVVIYGGYVYILTFLSEPSVYEIYSADFAGMLANFRFKTN